MRVKTRHSKTPSQYTKRQLIEALINTKDLHRAAAILDVHPNSLYGWFANHGMTPVNILAKHADGWTIEAIARSIASTQKSIPPLKKKRVRRATPIEAEQVVVTVKRAGFCKRLNYLFTGKM